MSRRTLNDIKGQKRSRKYQDLLARLAISRAPVHNSTHCNSSSIGEMNSQVTTVNRASLTRRGTSLNHLRMSTHVPRLQPKTVVRSHQNRLQSVCRQLSRTGISSEELEKLRLALSWSSQNDSYDIQEMVDAEYNSWHRRSFSVSYTWNTMPSVKKGGRGRGGGGGQSKQQKRCKPSRTKRWLEYAN